MNLSVNVNTPEYWNVKHQREYDLDAILKYEDCDPLSYHKVATDLIVENKSAIKRKKLLEIGCADGKFLGIISSKLNNNWKFFGMDFGEIAIEAAKKKFPHVSFKCKDIILAKGATGRRWWKPSISEIFKTHNDYGVVCMFEIMEHFPEIINYQVLNDVLNYCEYTIISIPNTIDDCKGEHISHYTYDTFEQKGYNVVWRQKLSKIDMSNVGDFNDYYYMIFLIRGELE